jgi:predicted XRE-type DNA-binding protein
MKPKAESSLGYKYSDESKKKMSIDRKGMFVGVNNPMYGMVGEKAPAFQRHHTKEEKQKISKTHFGEKNGQSKLNNNKVLEIKKLLLENELKQYEIADLFDVSYKTISSIKLNTTWSHIQLKEDVI